MQPLFYKEDFQDREETQRMRDEEKRFEELAEEKRQQRLRDAQMTSPQPIFPSGTPANYTMPERNLNKITNYLLQQYLE